MTHVSWKRVVAKKCYDIVVPLLTEMALKKLKFIPGRNESTMQRMLDLPFITCKYFSHYGSAMHSAKYVEQFISYVKENYHTNVYQMLNKEYLNEDDRRTICMHEFFMYGMYSEQYNRFTLAYLLVMEAVLEPRHKWTLLDRNTHYCHIEAYHIYIWRCNWRQNIWMQIFLDQEINDAMIHSKGPNNSCRRMLVNDHHHMSEYLRVFLLEILFLYFFFDRRFPFRPLTLKEICKGQLFVNIFIKRIDMILHLKLPTLIQNEHPEQYEDVEKFIDMGKWFVGEVDKKTKNKNVQCSIRNKIRYHRNISVPILESVLQEYVKAFCAPPLYTLALLRMGDSYRRYAIIYKLFTKHSRYGINI